LPVGHVQQVSQQPMVHTRPHIKAPLDTVKDLFSN